MAKSEDPDEMLQNTAFQQGLHSLLIQKLFSEKDIFVCFDSLCPSQHAFIHVGMGLPGLNQY